MSGFGGAGAFSDGKYNITNDFGGTLHEYIGKKKALELMRQYVENCKNAHCTVDAAYLKALNLSVPENVKGMKK